MDDVCEDKVPSLQDWVTRQFRTINPGRAWLSPQHLLPRLRRRSNARHHEIEGEDKIARGAFDFPTAKATGHPANPQIDSCDLW